MADGIAEEEVLDENKGEEDDEEIDLDLEDEGDDDEDKDKNKKEKKGKHANETPEQKSARLARMGDQHDKKHKLGKYAPKDDAETTSKKTAGLDYGQKAFLVSNGIKGKAEQDLAQKVMKSSGMTLDEVVEDGYFQNELTKLREDGSASDAIPKKGKNRAGNSGSDSVEYWVAKGELPPADQVELRRKVVNARMKAEGGGSNFTSNPVAGR